MHFVLVDSGRITMSRMGREGRAGHIMAVRGGGKCIWMFCYIKDSVQANCTHAQTFITITMTTTSTSYISGSRKSTIDRKHPTLPCKTSNPDPSNSQSYCLKKQTYFCVCFERCVQIPMPGRTTKVLY